MGPFSRIKEVNFDEDIVFRIQEGFAYAGSVFRARQVVQTKNGCIFVHGGTSSRTFRADFGSQVLFHEKQDASVLANAGFDMAASDAFLAEQKAWREKNEILSEQNRIALAKLTLLREAAPDLLKAAKEYLKRTESMVMACDEKEAQRKLRDAIAKAEGAF